MSESQPTNPADDWLNILLTMSFGNGAAVMTVQCAEDLARQAAEDNSGA